MLNLDSCLTAITALRCYLSPVTHSSAQRCGFFADVEISISLAEVSNTYNVTDLEQSAHK